MKKLIRAATLKVENGTAIIELGDGTNTEPVGTIEELVELLARLLKEGRIHRAEADALVPEIEKCGLMCCSAHIMMVTMFLRGAGYDENDAPEKRVIN